MPAPVAAAGIAAGGAVLSTLIGGKNANRAQDKAIDAQREQLDWVKSLFGERKEGIGKVEKWAQEEGLLDPQAMFDRIDSATAEGRARDQKNLVTALFKQGGFKEGETAAMNVLGNSELAHANARDREYLSLSVDAFGRRLALAGAPFETGLIGQAVNAGTQLSGMQMAKATNDRNFAANATAGLAGAWAQYEAYRQAQQQAQAASFPVTNQASGGGNIFNPGGNFAGDGNATYNDPGPTSGL